MLQMWRVEKLSTPSACLSQTNSPRNCLSATPRTGTTKGLHSIWHEMLTCIDQWRLRGAGWPAEQLPPDLSRARRCCRLLVAVVNQLPDDLLRRVLTVLAEELFYAVFRDYAFSYDPRATTLVPLSEERIANGVPYFAVVQSLRDAAKDAIMRRLELEARHAAGVLLEQPRPATGAEVDWRGCNQVRLQPGLMPQPPQPQQQQQQHQHSKTHSLKGEEHGSPKLDDSSCTLDSNLRSSEEELREELRQARLLADTYQARTLELERVRLDMEEEVSRMHHEREKADLRHQKLQEEVRRLRAEAEGSRGGRGVTETKGKAPGPCGKGRRPAQSATPLAEELAQPLGELRAAIQRHSGTGGTTASTASTFTASVSSFGADLAAGSSSSTSKTLRASAPSLQVTVPRSPINTSARAGSPSTRKRVGVERKASPKRVVAPASLRRN